MQDHVIYFLHGFAGDPADWDGVIAHLPDYKCQALTYPFVLPTNGILVGYSMGGRIALESHLPKIIISSNPSTLHQVKRGKWIERLKTGSMEQFFDAWYSQPLFESLKASPIFPQVIERRLRQDPQTLIIQLTNHPLKEHSLKAQFIHGELDIKYKQLYETLGIKSYGIHEAGHACHLENPAQVARVIRRLIATNGLPGQLDLELLDG